MAFPVKFGPISTPVPTSDFDLNFNYAYFSRGSMGITTGSANAQILTPDPAITGYAAGQGFVFVAGFTGTGTGSVTLSVSGQAPFNLVFREGVSGSVYPASIIQGASYLAVIDDPVDSQMFVTPLSTYRQWINISGSISATTFDISDVPPLAMLKAVTADGEFILPSQTAPFGADSLISAAAGTKTYMRAVKSSTNIKVVQRVVTDTSGGIVSTDQTLTSVWILM